ncbi:hypothetical protein [Streptomyces sp. NPDC021020]|uniref:LppU/SCO3897 family protein n=1 Tax=Streptomyces sp. NPDC021020 TaxID=3365109 RepID=UPI003789AF83
MEPLKAGDPAQVGTYQLVARLGTSGLGQVFAGRGPDGRLTTVTVLHARLAGDPQYREQFRRDVESARRITGPSLAPVAADTEGDAPWVATGSADAPSLATVAGSGPLPPAAVRDVGLALAHALRAVQAAGAKLTGIEPSQVLLTPEGPRLTHFGITQPMVGPGSTIAAVPSDADAVRALGRVLHFAATGQPAPAGGGWQQPGPRIADPVLASIVADCLAAQPSGPGLDTVVERLNGAVPPAMAPPPGFGPAAGPGMPPGPPPGFASGGFPPPPGGGIPPAPIPANRSWWRTGNGQLVAITAVVAVVIAIGVATTGTSGGSSTTAKPTVSASGLPSLPTLPGDSSDSSDSSDAGSSDGGSSDGGDDLGSDLPSDPPSADPVADAVTGDCFDNSGTATSPELTSALCESGTFKAVDVLHGTSDTHSCDKIPDDDWNVSYPGRDLVLCLSYQYEHGTAYHATSGECVYGESATSDWDRTDCQTGAFTVIARYTGTTSSAKCKGLRDYDWSEHFGITGRSDLDVTLCLSMVYPDDAGHAVLNECLKFTGSYAQPHMKSVSCSAANVIVTGRTSKYNAKTFCGNDAWTSWKPTDYASLAYTLCYRKR